MNAKRRGAIGTTDEGPGSPKTPNKTKLDTGPLPIHWQGPAHFDLGTKRRLPIGAQLQLQLQLHQLQSGHRNRCNFPLTVTAKILRHQHLQLLHHLPRPAPTVTASSSTTTPLPTTSDGNGALALPYAKPDLLWYPNNYNNNHLHESTPVMRLRPDSPMGSSSPPALDSEVKFHNNHSNHNPPSLGRSRLDSPMG